MKKLPMLLIVAYLSISLNRAVIAQIVKTQDSSKIINSPSTNRSKDIEELRTENKLIRDKIDTLNSINDKILNSVYWTIGTILTAIFGLTVWNAVKNRQLDEEKLKIVLDDAKKDLSKTLSKKLDDSLEKISFSDLSSIKSDSRRLKNDINDLRLYYIIRELKYHPFWNISDDTRLYEDYVNFIMSNKIKTEYKYLLETTINYLKTDPYMANDDRNKIINFMDQECSDDQYKFYVDQIKKTIESLS